MKLPNFLGWANFNTLRECIGAPLAAPFGPQNLAKQIDLPPIPERLQGEGIDIEFNDISVLKDKTLSYKGYRVLVYIRDVASYGRDRDSLPKFHVTYCSTLDKMRRDNRWPRYVVANRDDGKFKINDIDAGTSDTVKLNVCQMCLAQIAWKGFKMEQFRETRLRAVHDFSLTEFFEVYPRDLLSVKPEHTSDTARINDYVDNWPEISEATKKSAGYQCQSCAKKFEGPLKRFLQTHHRNGMKFDNAPSNLEVLCIGCHADEPVHGHMKTNPSYREYLQLFPK